MESWQGVLSQPSLLMLCRTSMLADSCMQTCQTRGCTSLPHRRQKSPYVPLLGKAGGEEIRPDVVVAVQIAEALQHLHARGIMHMDVKPDNIYTASGGTYKLGDFGLATCRGSSGQAQLQEGDSRWANPHLAYCVSLLLYST